MKRYPNLEGFDSGVFYEVKHKNGYVVTFVIEGGRDLDAELEVNKWLRARLKYLNDHGTMEGY